MALTPRRLKRLLRELAAHTLTPEQAFEQLQHLPFTNLGFARLDTHRHLRRRFPEVVFCEGKSFDHLHAIVAHLAPQVDPLLLTRLSAGVYARLRPQHPRLRYDAAARIGYLRRRRPTRRGLVVILTGGTADVPVAEEAAVVLEVMGHRVRRIYDVGVAGVHRLLAHRRWLQRAKVVIAVAGMEGALASVAGGLTAAPVIAVPTSVGYGASYQGLAALLAMLNSCVPGVVVVNIDNGFGAAYFAGLINR